MSPGNATHREQLASIPQPGSRERLSYTLHSTRGPGISGHRENTTPKNNTTTLTQEEHNKNTLSPRQRRRQSRRDKWQVYTFQYDKRQKYKQFYQGYHTFQTKLKATHANLSYATASYFNDPDSRHYYEPRLNSTNEHQVRLGQDKESREMRRTLELLQNGGTGFLPESKRHGWVRLMFENWNSLGIGTQSWKLDRLNYLISHLRIDIIAGCESQCDWTMVDTHNQFLSLLAPGKATKGMAAHNKTERIQKDQTGGTAIAGIGRICDVISNIGRDQTGLGRWAWIRLGSGTTTTRIVTAYLPHKPGRNSRGRTVWEQQSRYFEARGDLRYPSTIFIEHLLALMATWITNGEHVVLAIDANQDVYSGRLAQSLKEPPFQMTCLMKEATGEPVPNSHFSGHRQISTIFGTKGIITGHGVCFPHWFGIGDHRVMVLEISAHAAFKGDYPTIATPKARSLNSKIPRLRRQYCKTLSQLSEQHKIQQKLDVLTQVSDHLTTDQFQFLHDKYDIELGELMRHAEKSCTKRHTTSMEFSPTVGQWLKKRAVLKWILRWHEGKVPDPRNLLRAARRLQIVEPLNLTRQEIESRLVACMQHIYDLRQQAPTLRKRHLQWCLNRAQKKSDHNASKEIQDIIKAEARRRQQRRINAQIKSRSGFAVTSVKVDTPAGEITYTSRDQIEQLTSHHLRQRFSLGQRAPLHRGSLFQDFGTLGNTEATEQLFNGTYEFPEGCDIATMHYLQEATRIKTALQQTPAIQQEVSTQDFITFWSSAKESTSSSKSGRHFGHYKAIINDPSLVSLHVTNINLAATRGEPLQRWCEGVNVLLEKIAGDSHIDKLRAICLLEADFNWWLKVIFARRMMSHMSSTGTLPPEQGATNGKTPLDTSLLKQLFYDQANILHEDCSSSSTDAAYCYDSANHAACSIALQAVGVPINMVQCYLTSVQRMQYFLQTGFGLSTYNYGGTPDSISMGLTQGSGASPGAWSAISTVIVGAYKQQGYGAQFYSGWSGKDVYLAALLYVDDTDLLHSPPIANLSTKALVQWVQNAITCWANLLQATGGSLKPQKCYWYLLSYKFVNGTASLRPLSELRTHSVNIPQPNNSTVSIELLDASNPTKVLGVWTSPNGDGSKMITHMLDKGVQWAARVQTSTLHPREVWYSLTTQALPAVRYGLICVMVERRYIDKHLPRWYYNCLPNLGINRHIALQWRTLPRQFQGLGLPVFSLEKLADCLRLLQRHWGSNSTLGNALKCSFELVQLETGLAGNFLIRNYSRLNILATHSWFKLLWELIHYYKVSVEFPEDVSIPPIREHDRVLMEDIIKILPPSQWIAFNRVRKFHKIYYISQLTLCDGKTIDPALLSATASHQSTMRFPRECPTPDDFTLWNATLRVLTSTTLTLPTKLGHFIRMPYTPTYWTTNPDHSQLVLHSGKETLVYTDLHQPRHTRRRRIYTKSYMTAPSLNTTLLASVVSNGNGTYSLHSHATLLQYTTQTATTFVHKIRQAPFNHLYKNMNIDDDGDWIAPAARRGSLIIVHDGSYMTQVDDTICSAAVVLLCTASVKMGTIQLCEKTNHRTASNYRGEILGGIITSHILTIVDQLNPTSEGTVTCFCDNLGVIHHAHNLLRQLPDKQPQTDVLSCFRHNLAAVKMKWTYNHVQSHQDDIHLIDELPIPQQLNVLADALAKQALGTAHSTKCYNKPEYPGETIRIYLDGGKVTSSPKSALYSSWGARTARKFFDKRQIIRTNDFHLIHWDNLHKTMDSLPKMFQVWITKHVSGFCGNNRHLARLYSKIENRCHCCGAMNESINHITRCPNPGRVKMFDETVSDLIQWMKSRQGHPTLTQAIQVYLKNRGKLRMTTICQDWPTLHPLAQDHDRLGWDNFIIGRICKSLFTFQHNHLVQTHSQQSISSWACKFTQLILNIPHKQWLYRNARIHIRLVENMTAIEHQDIKDKVAALLNTDPDELLPQHRPLLLQQNFTHLGQGSTLDRQHWIAQMQSALAAAKHKRPREETDHLDSNKRIRI